jgi:uncharacterized membrane protein YhaH (DUF805 family)
MAFQILFEKHPVFSGRRSRASYALVSLVYLIVTLALFALSVRASFTSGEQMNFSTSGFALAILCASVPFLICTAQRCRDFGYMGWFAAFMFIPKVGFLVWIAILVMPGTVGPNKFGHDPRSKKKSSSRER